MNIIFVFQQNTISICNYPKINQNCPSDKISILMEVKKDIFIITLIFLIVDIIRILLASK
ncbi:unnamed protein product [Paramecium primaurelia]|uniref:Uncharacterized protein n=1 Tax=Paramecium primaurelia TaxID=5886 RepID=A0A8S1PTT3_PARPR|nr:unnamed protein product [Paramecium primaurelia]